MEDIKYEGDQGGWTYLPPTGGIKTEDISGTLLIQGKNKETW